MKRDMDLARRILLALEEAPFDLRGVTIKLPDVSEEALQYHLLILSEANLIKAIDASSRDGPSYLPERLTWLGHEFLDASRNDTFWKKAKTAVLEKTGGLAFDVLFQLLKSYARNAVLGGPDAA